MSRELTLIDDLTEALGMAMEHLWYGSGKLKPYHPRIAGWLDKAADDAGVARLMGMEWLEAHSTSHNPNAMTKEEAGYIVEMSIARRGRAPEVRRLPPL